MSVSEWGRRRRQGRLQIDTFCPIYFDHHVEGNADDGDDGDNNDCNGGNNVMVMVMVITMTVMVVTM